MLVRKLDEMGTKISATIVSELMGIHADIDPSVSWCSTSDSLLPCRVSGLSSSQIGLGLRLGIGKDEWFLWPDDRQ